MSDQDERTGMSRAAAHRADAKLPGYRLADRWSMALASAAAIGVPLWFIAAPLWNPEYTPIRPWVWAVPGLGCIVYLYVQFWLLLISAGRSDRIGMGDTVVSLVTFLLTFGTLVAVIVMWMVDRYRLGPFQVMTILTINVTALGELVFTGWVRYLVNRRYFGSVAGGV